ISLPCLVKSCARTSMAYVLPTPGAAPKKWLSDLTDIFCSAAIARLLYGYGLGLYLVYSFGLACGLMS
ncbi:hypothetical protein RJJ65_35665, partial [Rhizobium hidalgonense]